MDAARGCVHLSVVDQTTGVKETRSLEVLEIDACVPVKHGRVRIVRGVLRSPLVFPHPGRPFFIIGQARRAREAYCRTGPDPSILIFIAATRRLGLSRHGAGPARWLETKVRRCERP